MNRLGTGILFGLIIQLWAGSLCATTVTLDYIGHNPLRNGKPIKDTVPYVEILNKFEWAASVHTQSGKDISINTFRPDTLRFNEPFRAVLRTSFTVNQALLNRIYCMGYTYNGSAKITLNGEQVLATGIFATGKKDRWAGWEQNDYAYILFRDTAESMEIEFEPAPQVHFMKMELTFARLSNAEEFRKNTMTEKEESYSSGFYYLAFAIVFIIFFISYREKTENLYFSLFCLLASFAFLWDNMKLGVLPGLGSPLAVLSLEFLSVFFCKVIRNREKSRIPLAVIIVVIIISYHPSIYYNYTFISGAPIPILRLLIMMTLFIYTGVTSLYYLIMGIGQKRWEARAIVVIVSVAIVLFFLAPLFTVAIINAVAPGTVSSYQFLFNYLLSIGLYIYPLSAAIVLGRRNSLNQRQLQNQVKSIEQLSRENLEKEKEKQQLLENQNSALERKVAERTGEVQRQKELIELKNKAITDNINYAQRIQSAILPDIKLIYKALEQSFILFMPKDIVSGDFYAFAERNSKVIIIAGDCTGHGVSGAFMSMIGSSLLNQIINERGTYRPDLILNELNHSVIEALKQGENESNDGMDVSVCSFDLFNMELQFAGANRPLWLVRNRELLVFPPDKFPIGGLQMARDRVFSNTTIALEKGDSLYIFTDGFADQFGGAHGKKLMTAKFKELLVSMAALGMREQEQYLKAHFEQWKGSNEQVDDVLVIGVRV